jgi:hypothetical protein
MCGFGVCFPHTKKVIWLGDSTMGKIARRWLTTANQQPRMQSVWRRDSGSESGVATQTIRARRVMLNIESRRQSAEYRIMRRIIEDRGNGGWRPAVERLAQFLHSVGWDDNAHWLQLQLVVSAPRNGGEPPDSQRHSQAFSQIRNELAVVRSRTFPALDQMQSRDLRRTVNRALRSMLRRSIEIKPSPADQRVAGPLESANPDAPAARAGNDSRFTEPQPARLTEEQFEKLTPNQQALYRVLWDVEAGASRGWVPLATIAKELEAGPIDQRFRKSLDDLVRRLHGVFRKTGAPFVIESSKRGRTSNLCRRMRHLD